MGVIFCLFPKQYPANLEKLFYLGVKFFPKPLYSACTLTLVTTKMAPITGLFPKNSTNSLYRIAGAFEPRHLVRLRLEGVDLSFDPARGGAQDRSSNPEGNYLREAGRINPTPTIKPLHCGARKPRLSF